VTAEAPSIAPLGDGALLVTFGDRIDVALNARAHDLVAAVERLRSTDPRFGRAVPAYASVLVPFDPVAVDPDEAGEMVARVLMELAGEPAATPEAGDVVEIPVRYGGDDGPDLADVAALNDLRPSDIIELHAGTEYRVYFLGFAPGFAYLGTLPAQIATPRLPAPRERIPAGSVGIAGGGTAVYPFALPGGWRIIGRTDVPMWNLQRDSPALLRPGDRVRFVPSS
jgi:KipI family sensor histidine kinase inhibitor